MSKSNRTDRPLAQTWMSRILLAKSQKEARDTEMEAGERESCDTASESLADLCPTAVT